MLSISDTDIQETSSAILKLGYDVAFLVPTETGLAKSILDAHHSLRAFLKRNDIHDYQEQKQGVKRIITAQFITKEDVCEIKVSLYRPETKSGDPRIWIYGLKELAIAGNLLAIIFVKTELYIINCSHPEDLKQALKEVLPKVQLAPSDIANELLQKLVVISRKGFIPTVVKGDTGVGMTLESELGICANSRKHPDFKGIELKCTRVNKKPSKSNLFGKVPEWGLSPLKTNKNLVTRRGYIDKDGVQALRSTVTGTKANNRGLYLDIDYENSYLRQMFTDITHKDFNPEHDMTWLLSVLKKDLQNKHAETFWVKAQHNENRIAEKFYYVEAEHTVSPYIDKFETLIETGLITLDYTMSTQPSGSIKCHGPLFKLVGNKRALFPESTVYDLTKL